MKKQNKTQASAEAICKIIKKQGELLFVAAWKKSIYGYCPALFALNEKVAYASGCVYDRESAALSSFLCYLFESTTKKDGENDNDLLKRSSYAKIESLAGAGFDAIAKELKKSGWLLSKNYAAENIIAYKIKKL